MTEATADIPSSHELLTRTHDEMVRDLSEACIRAAMREDLTQVAAAHAEATGLANPNNAEGSFLFKVGDIPTKSDMAYRQVGPEAIEDFAEAGIVRNGATANEDVARRWGDRVFWHSGEDDKAINTGGRFVIEAPKTAAADGWVTADQVKSIYAKNEAGEVVDLLTPPKKIVVDRTHYEY